MRALDSKKYRKLTKILLIIVLLPVVCEVFSFTIMSVLSKVGIFDETLEAAKKVPRSLKLFHRDARSKYHPYLLYEMSPDSEIEGWGCKTDKYGFIHNGISSSFDPYNKEAGTYRIFFMGGSTAASYHAGSNDQTIPAYLEGFLNKDEFLKQKYGARRFEVVNAARNGYFSTQEFLFTVLDIVYYEPDMIITFDGYNEWRLGIETGWERHGHMYRERLERGFDLAQSVKGLSLMAVFIVKKNISNLLSGILHYTKFMLGGISHRLKSLIASKGRTELRKYPVDKDTLINEESVDVYRQNIMNFISASKIRGIRYIALLQPTFGLLKDRYGDSELRILREYGYALNHKRRYFKELKALFRDFKERYSSRETIIEDVSNIFENETDDIYIDFCHYGRRGNELIAKKVYEIIREQ